MEPFWVSAVTEQEERRLRRMAIKCFNCGDYHHLDDCPMVCSHHIYKAQVSTYKSFVNILYILEMLCCAFPGELVNIVNSIWRSNPSTPPTHVHTQTHTHSLKTQREYFKKGKVSEPTSVQLAQIQGMTITFN